MFIFFVLTHFRGKDRNCNNVFGGFLKELKQRKIASEILWPLAILTEGTFCFLTFRRDIYEKYVFNIYLFFLSLSPGYFLYSSALFATKEGAMASFTSPLNEKMTVCLQFQYWYEVNYLRTFFSPAFCKSSSCQNLTF